MTVKNDPHTSIFSGWGINHSRGFRGRRRFYFVPLDGVGLRDKGATTWQQHWRANGGRGPGSGQTLLLSSLWLHHTTCRSPTQASCLCYAAPLPGLHIFPGLSRKLSNIFQFPWMLSLLRVSDISFFCAPSNP